MPSERIEGQLSTDGSWTRYHTNQRTKEGFGHIEFDPDDKGGPVLSMRIHDITQSYPTPDRHWCGNEDGRAILCPDVDAGVTFFVQARGSNGATKFSGTLFW